MKQLQLSVVGYSQLQVSNVDPVALESMHKKDLLIAIFYQTSDCKLFAKVPTPTVKPEFHWHYWHTTVKRWYAWQESQIPFPIH